MILIDDVEIKTIGDNVSWNGSKDTVARTMSFTVLYVPEDTNFPKYQMKCGSKVQWVEGDKTLFIGYIKTLEYSTDGESVRVECVDLMIRLFKSKCVGRFSGTLKQLANNICGLFGIQNGIETDNTHVHNIVSTGDLTYYDVLKTACDSMFSRYCLYLDGVTLKIQKQDVIQTFTIGQNIRQSAFKQDLSDLVTKVLIIDNDGNLLNSVQDDASLKEFGLFQEVYTYSKDSKNNLAEAKEKLSPLANEATLVVNDDLNCMSGCFIRVIEPINNFIGIFEIQTDNHTIGADSVLEMEIEYVKAE